MKLMQTFLVMAVFFIVPVLVQAAPVHHSRLCGPTKKQGLASCHAHVVTDDKGNFLAKTLPSGFSPAQLRSAYQLSGRAGKNPIVAIVDAYDDPTIKADLDFYSRAFNLGLLPDCKSTIAKSS